jgi:hypothetical protein
MSLNALQRAEKRNSQLLDENANLRRQLAVLSGEKAMVDRELATARARLVVMRRGFQKKLERMEKMEKMKTEMKK